MKVDAKPLLQPGLHRLTLEEIKVLTVEAFPGSTKRADLFRRFLAWRAQLKQLGLSGYVWLDGSFLTEKEMPNDIDLIMWSPMIEVPFSDDQQTQAELLFDNPTCKAVYGLDVYLAMPAEEQIIHDEAYWKGMFGFCHDRVTAKGIAEVLI
ncbi:DUF6932 family protein [Comamonas aquatica]|uniref:Uncharacterized protein n=1 Tax=Comamonas aquatica DA1877 TaxID=1457173 RepID=A0A014MMS6_9BURK|nr:hypothetical protein [Comamonas aquatica]EXU79449.1 hypothetical protein AX13_04895 [Comamonas aquatica DA1877]